MQQTLAPLLGSGRCFFAMDAHHSINRRHTRSVRVDWRIGHPQRRGTRMRAKCLAEAVSVDFGH